MTVNVMLAGCFPQITCRRHKVCTTTFSYIKLKCATSYVLGRPFEYQTSTQENKMASICRVLKWLGCLVFNTGPLSIQPLFDHLNIKLRSSVFRSTLQSNNLDSHCTSYKKQGFQKVSLFNFVSFLLQNGPYDGQRPFVTGHNR